MTTRTWFFFSLSLALLASASHLEDHQCRFRVKDACVNECQWCFSDDGQADGCFTPAEALSLPSWVYSCEVAKGKGAIPGPTPVAQPLDSCKDAYSTKATCDAASGCVWCEAGAVPSACYEEANAERLPPGVFTCDNGEESGEKSLLSQLMDALMEDKPEVNKPEGTKDEIDFIVAMDGCHELFPEEEECRAASGCSWCHSDQHADALCLEATNSATLTGVTCDTNQSDTQGVPMPVEAISQLARAMSELHTHQPAPASEPFDTCKDAYSTKAACDAASGCVWCEAGAVPSACYEEANAKRLPPGVFTCDNGAAKNNSTPTPSSQGTDIPLMGESDAELLMNEIAQAFANQQDNSNNNNNNKPPADLEEVEADNPFSEAEDAVQNMLMSEVSRQQQKQPQQSDETETGVVSALHNAVTPPSAQVAKDDAKEEVRAQALLQPVVAQEKRDEDEETGSSASAGIVDQVLEGMLSMAVIGLKTPPSVSECLGEGATRNIFTLLNEAVENLSHSELVHSVEGIAKLGQVFGIVAEETKQASGDCSVLAKNGAVLKNLEHSLADPVNLQFQAGKKLTIDGSEMHSELSSAVADWHRRMWGGFGFKAGIALGKLSNKGEVRELEKLNNTPHFVRFPPHPIRKPKKGKH